MRGRERGREWVETQTWRVERRCLGQGSRARRPRSTELGEAWAEKGEARGRVAER